MKAYSESVRQTDIERKRERDNGREREREKKEEVKERHKGLAPFFDPNQV